VENENCNEEPDGDANQHVVAPTTSPAMNITTSARNDVQHFSHDALVIFSTSHANFILVIYYLLNLALSISHKFIYFRLEMR
jgi:hypothetical protein